MAETFVHYENPSAISSIKYTLTNWHSRLGHLFLKILCHLVLSQKLSIFPSDFSTFSCNECQCSKIHKLPFSNLSLSSTFPLNLAYSDVWGSPILSNEEYKYYVLFVDHFTMYLWLNPLWKKLDVHAVFICFKEVLKLF